MLGLGVDRWAFSNGTRQRFYGERDVDYRDVIRAAVSRWAAIHPDFGQSLASERWAIQQIEVELFLRKARFNRVAEELGEPTLL